MMPIASGLSAATRSDHFGQCRRGDLREGEIVLNAEMTLRVAGDAQRGVIGDNALLYGVDVGSHQAKALDPGRGENLVQCQHGRAGWDSGRGLDPLAQAAVGVKTEPPGGGAVPSDGVDFGVGQKFGGGQDRAIVELGQGVTGQSDLGHAEAGKVDRDIGHGCEHRRRDRLQRGVGRRGQHAKADRSGHA